MKIPFTTFAIALVLGASQAIGESSCKCGPNDACWPSDETWRTFNTTVENRLLRSEPLAISCYPGPHENLAQCAFVAANWANETFHTTRPLGLAFPINITCPPVNFAAGETPESCTLGSNPRYAVNASTTAHIRNTLEFAEKYNIRLVVKSTGHDMLGRSDGWGSLELWLRYHRNGIEFLSEYESSNECERTTWRGSAIKIGGGYQWSDVYAVAEKNKVIVVGGGSPSVGAVGGWATGGGHGPATRNYGLGADQILEAEVLLADGSLVTANACSNPDLYRAIRGGGPGYGILLSFTVKAYPEVSAVAVQRVEITPKISNDTSSLLDAISVFFQSYPELNDLGWAGYAFWYLNSIVPPFGNSSAGYHHTFWNIGTPLSPNLQSSFDPIFKRLSTINVNINTTYTTHPTYWSMYYTHSNLHDPVGFETAMTSRLFDPPSLSNPSAIRKYLDIASGTLEDFIQNVILLVSGGQVFHDASDPYSSVLPAWRKSHFAHIIARGWAPGSPEAVKSAIRNDVTNVRGKAQKKIASETGGYVNEGDRLDGEWQKTFFGEFYEELVGVKRSVDPAGLFWCPVCVGSEGWREVEQDVLCQV